MVGTQRRPSSGVGLVNAREETIYQQELERVCTSKESLLKTVAATETTLEKLRKLTFEVSRVGSGLDDLANCSQSLDSAGGKQFEVAASEFNAYGKALGESADDLVLSFLTPLRQIAGTIGAFEVVSSNREKLIEELASLDSMARKSKKSMDKSRLNASTESQVASAGAEAERAQNRDSALRKQIKEIEGGIKYITSSFPLEAALCERQKAETMPYAEP